VGKATVEAFDGALEKRLLRAVHHAGVVVLTEAAATDAVAAGAAVEGAFDVALGGLADAVATCSAAVLLAAPDTLLGLLAGAVAADGLEAVRRA